MHSMFKGLVMLTLCGHAVAADTIKQGTTQPEQAEQGTEVAEQVESRFSVTIDLTTTSTYYFRGIVQETDGFIFQPSIEIGVDFYNGEDWSISGYGGIWNSFHSEETGSTDTDQFVSTWYEVDFYAGLSASTGRMSFDLCYTNYASPNGAFGSINEIAFGVAFDDSGLWGDTGFALNPSATLALELGDNSGDGGTGKGVFLSVGIEPGTEISGTPLGDVSISFPIEAGFSLSDYYEVAGNDEAFGYLSAGVSTTIPLGFMPEGYGDWSLNTGVDFLMLGDNTEIYNSGEDSEWIFHAGVTLEF